MKDGAYGRSDYYYDLNENDKLFFLKKKNLWLNNRQVVFGNAV